MNVTLRSLFFYALGAEGFLLRTLDAGKTWTNFDSNVVGLAVDRAHNLFVLEADNTVRCSTGSAFTIVRSNVTALASDSAGQVYALGAEGFVIRTLDAGRTWTNFQANARGLENDVAHNLYILTAGGSVLSNGGGSLAVVYNGATGLARDSQGVVFGMNARGSSVRSIDAGKHWSSCTPTSQVFELLVNSSMTSKWIEMGGAQSALGLPLNLPLAHRHRIGLPLPPVFLARIVRSDKGFSTGC